MDTILYYIKKFIPISLFKTLQPIYHYSFAIWGAFFYRFPGRNIRVVAVTGTKGKSSVVEILGSILECAGYSIAISNTIHFRIKDDDKRNLFKMTMPGRSYLQKFLKRAVGNGCEYAIIEMTSEGIKLFRHIGIPLDALIFTNLSPEHIESHGSFEAYRDTKLKLRDALHKSQKKKKVVVSNTDDEHGKLFIDVPSATQLPYSLKDAEPYTETERGVLITIDGESIHSPLLGRFNIYNLLAAITFAKNENISIETIRKTIEKLDTIKGRVEHITLSEENPLSEKQNFKVIVDYAHTADSLKKLYEAFPDSRKICVLGNTGGGRDKWKRPEMAKAAEENCAEVILTNEDPYHEDQRATVEQMAESMEKKPEIIMDRRVAIHRAIEKAKRNDVVLITGKGTDPYIMGANNSKTVWSDEKVSREELEKVLTSLQNNVGKLL